MKSRPKKKKKNQRIWMTWVTWMLNFLLWKTKSLLQQLKAECSRLTKQCSVESFFVSVKERHQNLTKIHHTQKQLQKLSAMVTLKIWMKLFLTSSPSLRNHVIMRSAKIESSSSSSMNTGTQLKRSVSNFQSLISLMLSFSTSTN